MVAYTKFVQYTIRGVAPAIDNALRKQARLAGKSLNETILDALAAAVGVAGVRRKRRDLSGVVGSWKADKAVEAALAAQDEVDTDLWR